MAIIMINSVLIEIRENNPSITITTSIYNFYTTKNIDTALGIALRNAVEESIGISLLLVNSSLELKEKYIPYRLPFFQEVTVRKYLLDCIEEIKKTHFNSYKNNFKINEENYPQFVQNKLKPGEDILKSLTPELANLLHTAVGISGEAGEILDAVKKATIYGQGLTDNIIKNMIEELGDIEFYLEALRQAINISREQVIEANIKKLTKRYSEGNYSDKAAKERSDKLEGED